MADASTLPGNRNNPQILFNAPAAPATAPGGAPTAPATGGTNFVPRNPVTGAADYSHATGPQFQTGTMNAVITQPNPKAPKVSPPVVVTADAAEKNLANIKTQVDQLTKDVAAHKAAIATPQNVVTPDGTKTPTQTTPTPVETPAKPLTLDEKINDALNGLSEGNKQIDTTQTAALDPLATAQKQVQDAKDSAAVTALGQLDSIARGTYPLSSSESALLDSTRATYLNTIQGQTLANDAFTGQMTELAASLGISTSAPSQAIGMIHAAISQGNEKVATLNGQMAQALATLQQGFQKNDFDMVHSAWTDTAKYYDDRLSAIADMQKAVIEGAKQQKTDLKDLTTLTLDNVVKSATFTQKQKQDAIDNAFKANQITETQRHDYATEAISKENADNNSSTGGGSFTKTQSNKGAANAGVDVSEFAAYPSSVKNFYINNVTQAKAFNQLVADRQSGKETSKSIADTITSSNVPDDVKTWMYQAAGVDASGNPTDGKQDSGLTSGLQEAGNFLGDSYDNVKNWLGIQ